MLAQPGQGGGQSSWPRLTQPSLMPWSKEGQPLCGHVHRQHSSSEHHQFMTPHTQSWQKRVFVLHFSVYSTLFISFCLQLREAADERFSFCTLISFHHVASSPSPWATSYEQPWSRSCRNLRPGRRELETRWGSWAPTLGLGCHPAIAVDQRSDWTVQCRRMLQ